MLQLGPARALADALSTNGIRIALGGSGLLCSLGLTDEVAAHGDPPFASRYRLTVESSGPQIDLIGLFAVEAEHAICRLPTIVCAVWDGLPVGSPAVWAVAYRLMKRHAKADLLSEYLRHHCTDKETVAHLLRQPLPTHHKDEIATWI